MSDHLPECPFPKHYWRACICAELRACEQRVREEESRNVIGSVSLAAIGEANLQQYQLGFATALDAAREAVDGLAIHLVDVRFDMDDEPDYKQTVELTKALAAIDALLGNDGDK